MAPKNQPIAKEKMANKKRSDRKGKGKERDEAMTESIEPQQRERSTLRLQSLKELYDSLSIFQQQDWHEWDELVERTKCLSNDPRELEETAAAQTIIKQESAKFDNDVQERYSNERNRLEGIRFVYDETLVELRKRANDGGLSEQQRKNAWMLVARLEEAGRRGKIDGNLGIIDDVIYSYIVKMNTV